MITPSNERGLSEVLGAILIFALVFAVLVIIQVWAVPTANAQVELEHSQNLESDYAQFVATSDRAALLGTTETVSLDAGLRYPSRIFLLNPPPASYTFSSSTMAPTSVANIEAAADDEADDYFEDISGILSVNTQSYALSSDYSQYQDPPTFNLENGISYKAFENGEVLFIDEGNIVDGRRITLVAYEGDVGEGGSGTLSFPVQSIAGPTQSLTVTNRVDSTPIIITLPTELTLTEWESLLGDQVCKDENPKDNLCDLREDADPDNDPAGYITNLEMTGDGIAITLERGVTYDLRLSKLSVGATGEDLGPHYVVKGSSTDPVISTGGTDLSVQVRNELNNPVSGAAVTFSSNEGTFQENGKASYVATTDTDGFATARFLPNSGETRASVSVKGDFNGDSSIEPHEMVSFSELQVGTGPDGGVETDFINPTADTIVLTDVTKVSVKTDSKSDYVVLEFTNKAERELTLIEARVNFFYLASPGIGKDTPPTTARLTYLSSQSNPLTVTGTYVDVTDLTFGATGNTQTADIEIRFYDDIDGKVLYGAPNGDDFFVITFLYEDGENIRTATYFVQVFPEP